MNIKEALNLSFDKALERGKSRVLPREKVAAPLAEEQIEGYIAIRQLLDPKFKARVQTQSTTKEFIDGQVYRDFKPDITELLHTDDAAQLFRKVFNDILIEPDEPNLIFTKIFPTIRLEGIGETIRVTLTDAVTAQLANEGQPLGDTNLSFAPASQQVQIVKVGIQYGLTKEVIEQNQWDLIGLHTRACANGLARFKEEYGWNSVMASAVTRFDGDDASKTPGGVGADGVTANGTLTLLDFVDLMATLINNGQQPTDFVYNPAAWAGLLKDELLSRIITFGVGRPYNQAVPSMSDLSLPYALSVHMCPWMPTNLEERANGDPVKTDMLMVDRNRSATLVQQQDPEASDWWEPAADIYRQKFIERYGVAIAAGGRGAVKAVNITADVNYAPYPVIRTVTA